MRRRAISAAGLMFLAMTAHAADMPVYESLNGIEIGRVFLSQAQRDALDRSRARGDSSDVSDTGPRGKTNAPASSSDAAGYIISESGKTRIWKRGDFVAGEQSDADRVKFPGEVRVERHEPATRDD